MIVVKRINISKARLHDKEKENNGITKFYILVLEFLL